MVISPKFGQLLETALLESQDKSQDADYDRCRRVITYLLIQLIKDAHDLYQGNLETFHNTSNPTLLCAREGRALEDWIKTHERFPFYCAVLGFNHDDMRTFILEVGSGQHELEVHRILRGLQNKGETRNRQPKQKVKVASS